jgi:Yip1 domain
VAAEAPTSRDQETLDRDWWLRIPAVLQSPRAVFSWFRVEAQEQEAARQEPVLALVLLAGISGILSLDATGTLLDYPTNGNLPLDGVLVPVVVFIQGALYGAAAYWFGGLVFYLGLRGAGSTGTYRRARHLLAYSAVPLLLSLAFLWPVKLAVFGGDAFRTGGADDGTAGAIFRALELGMAAWAFVLVVIAIRVVESWSIPRTLGSLVLAAFSLVGISLVVLILSAP